MARAGTDLKAWGLKVDVKSGDGLFLSNTKPPAPPNQQASV